METDGVSARSLSDDEVTVRLSALTERHDALREKLFNCRDQKSRILLVEELEACREELAQLKAGLKPAPAPGANGSESQEASLEVLRTLGHVDSDQIASPNGGFGSPPPSTPRPDDGRSGERAGSVSTETLRNSVLQGNRLPALGIVVTVVAVAALAWFLFLRSDGSPVPLDETRPEAAAGPSMAEQVQLALNGFGYESIAVEERSGTLYLTGVVGPDNHQSVLTAVQTLAGDMPLDSSGLAVLEPEGSTAPSTSPPEISSRDPVEAVVPVIVDGPYVLATLDGRDFSLAGEVPSAELAGGFIQAAEFAFAPYVSSELSVDEQLDSVEWLSGGPNAIVLLPMMIDGTILIADGEVTVWGRAPDQATVDRLQGALGQMTGLPVAVDGVEVTDLSAPSYVMAADLGVVELSGSVPTGEIRDMLIEGAEAAYGTENVVDGIEVDQGVYPALWMYNGGPLMQAMSTFPDYELRIDGMAFSGFINGGVTFETGSANFSGDYASVLDVGVGVLTRDPSLQLVIEGHTDDRGSDDANLDLSQRRAEAVRDYFIAAGIDPSRLTAVGFGESQPVVPNDSEEGRARNRRIQYVLSSG